MSRARSPRLLLVLLLAGGAAPAAADESVRCPGGLVSVGDWKIDLLGKCGDPTLLEQVRTEGVEVVRVEPGDRATSVRTSSAVERWTYDFGRSQFLRIVTLEGGRVRAVETAGRGHAREPSRERRPLPIATCDHIRFHVGEEAYEVLARCGPPATRDVRLLERAVELREGDATVQRSATVPIEVWGYHFGPQILTRILELEDGRVVRVVTAGHGYAP